MSRHHNAYGHEIYSIRECFEDQRVSELARIAWEQLFLSLTGSITESLQLVTQLWNVMNSCTDTAELEIVGHRLLAQEVDLRSSIESKLWDRARLIARQVEEWVKGTSVLDVGCGDGLVSQELKRSLPRLTIELFDVQDYVHPSVQCPRVIGDDVGAIHKGFDTVLLLTVLHHCKSPDAVLEAASHIAGWRIVVLESVFGVHRTADSQYGTDDIMVRFSALNDTEQFKFISLFDWFYNRVLHKEVNVPLNFDKPSGWCARLGQLGTMVGTVYLGIDQALVPEYHVLYAIDKCDLRPLTQSRNAWFPAHHVSCW